MQRTPECVILADDGAGTALAQPGAMKSVRVAWMLGLVCSVLAGCGGRHDAASEGEARENGSRPARDEHGVLPTMPNHDPATVRAPKRSAAEISERAFAAKAKLTPSEASFAEFLEPAFDFDFNVRIERAEDSAATDRWVLTAASHGEISSAPLTEVAPGVYAIDPVAYWFDAALVVHADEPDMRLYVAQLKLVGAKPDAAGKFTAFQATGSGNIESESGDVRYGAAVNVSFEGSPDGSTPDLAMPGYVLNPLDESYATASEVLAPVTKATIDRDDGSVLELRYWRPTEPEHLFWGFVVPPLLGFGQVVELRTEGADWAGNAFTSKGRLETLADPGLLAQDGFESTVPALAAIAPELVTEDALSGTRSLKFEEGDDITFHLATHGGSVLKLLMRQLPFNWSADDETDYEPVRVTVGVVGGTRVQTKDFPLHFREGRSLEGDNASLEFELPLAEEGDELIVNFRTAPFGDEESCGLIPCFGVGALIDDLRVE